MSFVGMLSVQQYFLSQGQNDSGMLNGKHPFVEYFIDSCKGSSGPAIFAFVVNHETGEEFISFTFYRETK